MSKVKKSVLVAALAVFLLSLAGGLVGCPIPLATWYRYIGGDDGDDGAYAAATTSDKGFVLAGFVERDHDTDDAALVIRLDARGAEQWRAEFDDDNNDIATAVAQAADGGYFVAGTSERDDRQDVFLLKLDADGNREWVEYLTAAGMNEARGVVPQADGGCIVGLHLDTLGASEVALHRRNADGSAGWTTTAATAAHLAQATCTAGGGAAVAWWTIEPTVSGDEVTFSAAAGILKVDGTGAPLWNASVPLETPSEIRAVAEYPGGGFVLAGKGDFLIDDASGIVIMVNPDGSVAWTKNLGEEGRDRLHDIAVTPGGRIAVAGEFGLVNDRPHMYLAVLRGGGGLAWQRTYGGDESDVAYALGLTPDGGFLLAGLSESEGGEDDTPDHEMLVIKTNADGRIEDIVIE
jgi:hypothetical protein